MGKHVQTSVLSDYSKYPSFGVATGTANTYSITLSPAPTAYSNGFGVTVVIPADSSGASTLNVNGLGAKTLKKANGNDVTNLKANGVYTFRYNSTTGNFILQGEGGSGNATAADIVAGKTASTDLGDIVGTATVASLGGKRYAIGTLTSSSSMSSLDLGQGGTGSYRMLQITGLSFSPNYAIAWAGNGNSDITVFTNGTDLNNGYTGSQVFFVGYTSGTPVTGNSGATFNNTSSGVTLPVTQASTVYNFLVIE